MTRPLLRLIFPLTLLFTAPLLALHAWPVDERLRAVLLPPAGCAAPCWLGVQPGLMTVEASLSLLHHHPWIESLDTAANGLYRVAFSPLTPISQLGTVYMWENQSLIERLEWFDSGLKLGDLRTALGEPSRIVLYGTIQYGVNALIMLYAEQDVYIYADLHLCSLSQTEFWNDATDVTISIGRWRDYADTFPDYYLSGMNLDNRSWANALRDIRRC